MAGAVVVFVTDRSFLVANVQATRDEDLLRCPRLSDEAAPSTLGTEELGSTPAAPPSHTCYIIYVSDGFVQMTGFKRAEVVRRAGLCEFLHGPLTSPTAVAALQQALREHHDRHFEILYYRKDGERRRRDGRELPR